MDNIKNINIRFNLDKPEARLAWEKLQERDRGKDKSYSKTIIHALLQYFDTEEKETDIQLIIHQSIKDSLKEFFDEIHHLPQVSKQELAEKQVEMKPKIDDELMDMMDELF